MTRTPRGQSNNANRADGNPAWRRRSRPIPTRRRHALERRPALVMQADFYVQKIGNVLLASITTNLARQNDPAHYFIDISANTICPHG
jgi:mRNA-degrading endonuclease toxin of MazEF toxin-antitoxin module